MLTKIAFAGQRAMAAYWVACILPLILVCTLLERDSKLSDLTADVVLPGVILWGGAVVFGHNEIGPVFLASAFVCFLVCLLSHED